MDKGYTWDVQVDSPSIQHLFDFEIEQPSESADPFCKSLLAAVHFDDLLEEIQSLSRTLVFQRKLPDTTEHLVAGTVYVFEVDVFSERGKLQLRERVCI